MSSWIDRYVSTVKKYTSSPEVFIRTAAYYTAGAAIQKRAFFRTSSLIFPNLYVILVAPPGRYHKSEAFKRGIDVLEAIVPQHHFLPQGGSDQGFDVALSETDGYGIAFYDELSRFLGLSSKEHTSQMKVKFLEYFDPTPKDTVVSRTKTDGELVIPKGTVVTFGASCTDDDFINFIGSGAVPSGQLSRCLIVSITEKDARPEYEPQPVTPDHVVPALTKDLEQCLPKTQTEFVLTGEADRWLKETSAEIKGYCDDRFNPRLEKAIARVTLILRKLALVHAVCRGSKGEVDAQDLYEAWEGVVGTYYIPTLRHFTRYGEQERQDQALRSKVLRYLEYRPSTVLILSRDLNERPEHVFSALTLLIKFGLIYREKFDGMEYYRAYQSEVEQDHGLSIVKEDRMIRKLRTHLREEGRREAIEREKQADKEA